MSLHQQKIVNPWDLEYALENRNVMDKIAVTPDNTSSKVNNSDFFAVIACIFVCVSLLYRIIRISLDSAQQTRKIFKDIEPTVPRYEAQVITDQPKTGLLKVEHPAYLRALVHDKEKEQCFQQNAPEFYILQTDAEKFHKQYSLTSTELGQGASGKVFLATRNHDLKKVAVKRINLKPANLIKLGFGQILPKEIYFLKKVRDIDGCVKLVDYFIIGEECLILTEYHENSVTLTDFINSHEQLSENRVIHLFEQILSVVSRLKIAGIAHRDLKGCNILVDKNENILVIDFGLATSLDKANRNVCGTRGYLPPEVDFCVAKYRIGPATTWSLGIILGSLLIGREPFDNGRCSYKAKRVIELELRKRNASGLARSLVRRCLQLTRKSRPSVKEILKDPWLNLGTYA
ncbi:serine/threonine-protein kinase pim-2-like [Artemia franciscana]|uniref:serine/threonine-protein kinase pim-2-like n=1 Tax=Artemia franciscana TaxID=6661 RepID=UPI0032DAD420